MTSRARLAAEKALWQRKVAFRHNRWTYYRDRSKQTPRVHTLRVKWFELLEQAKAKLGKINAAYQRTAPRLTARDRAIAWERSHVGVHEEPPGSNRGPLIDRWQRVFGFLAAPWCGIFAGNALLAAGVKGVTSRIASVSAIEDDARAHRGCFFGYTPGAAPHALLGDLVILFGRGIHVELITKVYPDGSVDTIGGNTSATAGSGNQSDGGCVASHHRSAGEIHGVAHVRYP